MTTSTLLRALCAYVPRDRVEHILHPNKLLASDGVALIADISGFTPLTEALTHNLQADQGAEELTGALEKVFTPLIDEVHAYYGSVIKFGGDALIVWFPRSPREHRSSVIRRAITSAWRMQAAIQTHGQIPTPIGIVTLQMKVGLTYGAVKRFNLGSTERGYEDVLGGQTLDRMADAEHHAEPGDIMLDRATLNFVPNTIAVNEWRDDFAVVGDLLRHARPKPWPDLEWAPDAADTLIEQISAYVPDQIYRVLKSGQSQVAELKPVVSLFIQFHGIDYDQDPKVAEKLQTYFSTAQRIAERYGGRVNRLITGDKGSLIHAIFGAPKTVEEQEVRAVRCALDMQRECGGLSYISMQRIGITLGRVFAGPVGSPSRHDYTTMGDSINLSARLMQHAADDQVLIEDAIQRALPESFDIADLGEITVKGKSAPIPVFAALAANIELDHIADKQIRPIIGRDQELATLQNWLGQLIGGHGGIATLIGEVGMGKTHMLTGLQAQASLTLDIEWASGICLAYGQTLSGYLFIDLLRSLIKLPTGSDPDQASAHLADFCRSLFGSDRVEATYPYLARFMGLPLADDLAQRIEGLSGESLRWQVFEVFRDLIRQQIAQQPLVLALDDLQWADPTSIQLLETLLPLVSEGPLLLLLAMRPERESRAWALTQNPFSLEEEGESPTNTQNTDHSDNTTVNAEPISPALSLTLGPLASTAAAHLIAHFAPNLPQSLLNKLVEKSGGNPLFLVEIVRTLEAQGILTDDTDVAKIDLGALDLPNSVQELLLAQIDRLTIEARHTLQMASVIGKTFLYKVLDELAAGQRNLDDQLLALEDNDYINQDLDATDDLGLAYIFRHGLIQESAYGTLLYQRRRAYHRQVAEILERLFPTQLMEQAGLLAYHYEQADDINHAITYHLQAADNARLIWANEEAEILYEKVLTLFDLQEAQGSKSDPERRAKTYLKLAQVRSNAMDFEGAQEFYELAFGLFEKVEQRSLVEQNDTNGSSRTIRLGVLEQGPSTLDPGRLEVTDFNEIVNDLFEGLVELDSELNIIPALARKWIIDSTGGRYKFHLREGLEWSDGEPLTAYDFVFAWQRNLDPQTGSGVAHLLYAVQGAEAFHQGESTSLQDIGVSALDELTLEITLKVPTSYFLYLLADPISFPQPQHLIRKKGNNWHSPMHLVCNGPFKIASWLPGKEIRLEQNPRYRGLRNGNLEEVSLKFIEPSYDHYMTHSLDLCRAEDRSDISQLYSDEVFMSRQMTTFFLGFSNQNRPFHNLLIRSAFAMCIDKQNLVKSVWSDVQYPATGGMIPFAMPGFSPEISPRFDPELGKKLLSQSGIDLDNETFKLATLPWLGETPYYLQQEWYDHLGVKVQIIKDMPTDEIVDNLNRGEIQLALLGWDAEYPDPDSILRILFHSKSPMNCFGWQNIHFDQLIEDATSLNDQAKRLQLYHQADKVLVSDDIAVVPLYYNQTYNLLRSGFTLVGAEKTIRGATFRLKNIQAV